MPERSCVQGPAPVRGGLESGPESATGAASGSRRNGIQYGLPGKQPSSPWPREIRNRWILAALLFAGCASGEPANRRPEYPSILTDLVYGSDVRNVLDFQVIQGRAMGGDPFGSLIALLRGKPGRRARAQLDTTLGRKPF